mmetsp:Transcript_19943/g.43359  ORF Transcript_19943/g.43359 Transcript_19943/m.43359 type:complete len:481 (-) Transcript_19943:1049-2491(-)|eukprot:CAMPEP_0168182616 /NCGR_PEP_ID=MMETSP0139_2-20121125/11988_1 /TAXON_ID=44445 /ORGANISM="Pseudo-nitzschia australis, Strain 10249 10 AB" /LENGTH=480 /DNA_ID=CAMNT_0008103557 /DNA_START=31 /DNA_END=1473 /DNA_ORIENTATION=+
MGKCALILTVVVALALAAPSLTLGFQLPREMRLSMSMAAGSSENGESCSDNRHFSESCNSELSRRDACRSVIGTAVTISSGLVAGADPVLAVKEDENGFAPAIRPTAYLVDSTIPPSLVPLSSARKEKRILNSLGSGSGTNKEEINIDTLNLNNFMNKLVFGSIDFVSQVVSQTKDESKVGPGYASFVCMGMPSMTTSNDIDLATSLMNSMLQVRKNELATALALSFCPMSLQSALDAYAKSGNESMLQSAMKEAGVVMETIDLYMPLIRYAKSKSLDFLAMSPEFEDIKAARTDGLGTVDFNRRQSYVLDPEGFISVTKDPRYKLYTDRSLLKDFEPANAEDNIKGFFAERIFVHETGASLVASYAVDKPESLVVMVSPISDVRYLQGINGRIPRVYGSLVKKNNANGTNSQPVTNKVSNDAVTTILLNPTAPDTLSAGRRLRLEIGTGPDTIDIQTKIADYIWFSASPKVSLIPRLMN